MTREPVHVRTVVYHLFDDRRTPSSKTIIVVDRKSSMMTLIGMLVATKKSDKIIMGSLSIPTVSGEWLQEGLEILAFESRRKWDYGIEVRVNLWVTRNFGSVNWYGWKTSYVTGFERYLNKATLEVEREF